MSEPKKRKLNTSETSVSGYESDNESDDEDDESATSALKSTDSDTKKANGKKKNKKKPTKKSDVSPDDFEVISDLHSHTNLFHMEVRELLSEVKADYDPATTGELQAELSALQKLLLHSLPEFKVTGGDYSGVALHNEAESLKLMFKRPKAVELVGSLLLRSLARPQLTVDVAVQMPSSCFKEKDVLDYRYLDKRALYALTLAKQIAANSNDYNVALGTFRGSAAKPVVVLRRKEPPAAGADSYVIRLIPTYPVGTFPLSKLLPNRNNNRRTSHPESPQPPTPRYNGLVAEDAYFGRHLKLLHGLFSQCPPLIDLVLLLKVWLRRRDLDGLSDTFNGFLLTMFAAHLYSLKRIAHGMSPIQMFKIVLQHLATLDISKGILMSPELAADAAADSDAFASDVPLPERQRLFVQHSEVAFVDPTGFLNLAARVSLHAFKELQREAAHAVEYMNDRLHEPFEALFVTRSEFHLKYDAYLSLPARLLSDAFKNRAATREDDEARCDREADEFQRRALLAVLEKGLTDRVTAVRCPGWRDSEWSPDKAPPSRSDGESLVVVGLVLSPVRARSKLDVGPSAEDAAAVADFKSFWGSRAELRRFKDGKIVQAVVWEDAVLHPGQPPQIMRSILLHLLKWHFGLEPGPEPPTITFVAHQLDSVLSPVDPDKPPADRAPQTDGFVAAVATLDLLNKQLRGMLDLPLVVDNLLPISPGLRYTDVFQPQRIVHGARKQHVQPLTAFVVFEASQSWPDDLVALQHLKGAFYLRLAAGLRRVHGYQATATEKFVEVQANDFVFHLVIHVHREAMMMKPNTPELRAYQEEHEHRPAHHASIHAFHLRFPVYGPTVRLALRWLHSHMFSGHFTHEAVELLVASLFVTPRPYAPPANHLVGFFRFLRLLATFDFESTPVVVDLDSRLTPEDYEKIQATFSEVRKQHPNDSALFIATAQDKASQLWTAARPTKLILRRIVAYARQSAAILDGLCKSGRHTDAAWQSVFRTPHHGFDVIVRLHHNLVPHYDLSIAHTLEHKHPHKPSKKKKALVYKNLQLAATEVTVGFEPVKCLVRDLLRHFGEHCLCFFDELGGNVVGLVWKPAAFAPHPLRVTASSHAVALPEPPTKPASAEFVFNIVDALSAIRSLGEGLVADVQLGQPATSRLQTS